MNVQLRENAGEFHVTFTGRLDAAAFDSMDQALKEAINSGCPRIVLNLEAVDYICSACIRPILKTCKQLDGMNANIEIIHASAEIKRILFMVGLSDLMPLGDGPLRVLDIFQRANPCNEQVLHNIRRFFEETCSALGMKIRKIQEFTEEFFYICQGGLDIQDIENRLRSLFADFELRKEITDALSDNPEMIRQSLSPYLAPGTLTVTEGNTQVFPVECADNIALVFALHCHPDPMLLLQESREKARKRILVLETVYLNEANRRFNIFFDWFCRRILHDFPFAPARFNTPEGWQRVFLKAGLKPEQSIELGLDQPSVPEYHWLYVLEKGDAGNGENGSH